MATLDLAGKRFGRLEVLARGPKIPKHSLWICRCDCGTLTAAKGGNLNSGSTNSCGCLHRELSSRRNGKHWMSADCTTARDKKLYKLWTSMKKRCANPNSESWKDYGGRGIRVCDEWQDYPAFYQWAKSAGYKEGLTLDRIDVNGHYAPDNCRWANAVEQARNRRNTPLVLFNGRKIPVQELTEKTGVLQGTVVRRIRQGKPPEVCFREILDRLGATWDGTGIKAGKDGIEITDMRKGDE